MNRRSALILGFSGLGILAFALRPKNKGMAYSPSFDLLNKTLKSHKKSMPFLVIDLDALDYNLAECKRLIRKDSDFRIVVKSLPSLGMLDYIIEKTTSKKLMVFHQPFLAEISKIADKDYDILLGKPMPKKSVENYYDNLEAKNGFDPSKQLQWLVDTKDRILSYLEIAKQKNLLLKLNCEIDVGLHRGGFNSLDSLKQALTLFNENNEKIKFSGFMGYDPHVVKVPPILASREKLFKHACNFYNACKDLVKNEFPNLWDDNLTFNGAGSPTLALHKTKDSPLNDVSAGSFAVKPTDFDIDTLEQFRPASYIATPILKKMEGASIPGLEGMKSLMSIWDPNLDKSYFVYGGSWWAKYYEPKGVEENSLFGRSTNQVMINSSGDTNLEVDDFVFLRPTQSEHVFLQFDEILAYRSGQIVDIWQPMS